MIRKLCIVMLLAITSPIFGQNQEDCSDEASGDTPCTFKRADSSQENSEDDIVFHKTKIDGTIHLYFFHKIGCSHCREAKDFFKEELESDTSIEIHSFEFNSNPKKYTQILDNLEKEYKQRIPGFPVILVGKQLITGFHKSTSPKQIKEEIQRLKQNQSSKKDSSIIEVPILGKISASAVSLLPFTINIGLIDGLNPCAIWVLMVLLSLMIRAESRSRIALIGGIFVITSGTIYFLFMAAWLNIFALIGLSKAVTVALGLLAVGIGLLNIKELFFFKKGVSLMIPEKAKPKLYEKARHLFKEKNTLLMIAGTISFAVFVNLIELGCTIGLPAVYTRILSIRETPMLQKYLYMGLYCTAYVVPLLFIVSLFFFTMGRFTLGERGGKVLKIINGSLMLGLGIMLLAFPGLLLG